MHCRLNAAEMQTMQTISLPLHTAQPMFCSSWLPQGFFFGIPKVCVGGWWFSWHKYFIPVVFCITQGIVSNFSGWWMMMNSSAFIWIGSLKWKKIWKTPKIKLRQLWNYFLGYEKFKRPFTDVFNFQKKRWKDSIILLKYFRQS